ncbi:MAG: PilN domain-containing protein [Phycisphaerales bacterium]
MSQVNKQSGGSFLPKEYVKGRSQFRANVMALLLFVLVIGGVVGAFVVNHQRWRRVHQEQKQVAVAFKEEAAKIEQLKELETQRVELIERAEVVTALKDRIPRSVLMGEIVLAIPDGLTLTEVTMEGERIKPPAPKKDPKAKPKTRALNTKSVGAGKDNEEEKPKVLPPRFKFTLAIEGIAMENDQVADFLSSIKASPLFEEVELPLIDETIIDKQAYRKFKVTMNLRERADARLVKGTEEFKIGRVEFGIAETKTDSE